MMIFGASTYPYSASFKNWGFTRLNAKNISNITSIVIDSTLLWFGTIIGIIIAVISFLIIFAFRISSYKTRMYFCQSSEFYFWGSKKPGLSTRTNSLNCFIEVSWVTDTNDFFATKNCFTYLSEILFSLVERKWAHLLLSVDFPAPLNPITNTVF
jgi:hypothetical protein